ncbi:hypothetical protein TNCV_559071 [Trichonephila clavipes]|nr:hypothetical protein TNCV_559071 [Trichonephila clavipes]
MRSFSVCFFPSCRSIIKKIVIEKGGASIERPTGWHGWVVAGLLHPRLRVRPRPKSVDFHDAENRLQPCRTIIWHVKDPQSVCLAWMLSAKLNPGAGTHRQSSDAFLCGGNWASKLLAAIGIRLFGAALKRDTSSRE